MRIQWMLGGAALALAAAAQAATPAKDPAKPTTQEVIVKKVVQSGDGKEVEGATPEAVALIAKCDAHKFETSAVVGEGKDKRITKIKLCAKAGESDAQWIVTLHKAVDQIGSYDEISAESRAKISAELKAEIARLEGGAAKPAN